MTLNGVLTLILRYFTEFVYDVVVKSSRSLSHFLMSFLYFNCTLTISLAKKLDLSRAVSATARQDTLLRSAGIDGY